MAHFTRVGRSRTPAKTARRPRLRALSGSSLPIAISRNSSISISASSRFLPLTVAVIIGSWATTFVGMATESLMAYQRAYHERPRIDAVLALLLLDETNPRSLAFQLGEIQRAIAALAHDDARVELAEEERLVSSSSSSAWRPPPSA